MQTLDWSDYAAGTFPTTYMVGDVTVTLTVTQSGGSTTGSGRIGVGPDGGFPSSQQYLEVLQGGSNPQGATVSVQFTFSQPVDDLTFTIADVDAQVPLYQEGAYLTGPSSFTVVSLGSALGGAGTPSDPWTTTSSVGPSSGDANVTVMYGDPVTTFTVSMVEMINASSGHSIDVFPLTWTSCP